MKKHYLTIFMFVAFAFNLSAQVYVKHDAAGANNGSSWANAYINLEIALANTTSGQVWVAAGTYRTSASMFYFNLPNGVALYGGFAGTETSLGQRNPTANVTVLSADVNGNDTPGNFAVNRTDNSKHVIVIAPGANTSVVDGFTISGGNTAPSGPDFDRAGGGIFTQGSVSVKNCNFNNNFGALGGAIFMANSADNSSVASSIITDNRGVGALYMVNSDNVDVDSCLFTDNINETASTTAGAFYAVNCINLSLSNSMFSGNSAANGGALYCVTDSLPAVTNADNFVISNCAFTDNSNTNGVGGAARFRNCSYTMVDCLFDLNSSTSSGGHIRNDIQAEDNVVYQNCIFRNAFSGGWGGALTAYGGTFTISDCLFEANTATRLGGAVNNGFAGTMTYTNCVFLNNQASGTASGGALGLQNDGTTVNVVDCNFIGNSTTGQGGAIFSGAASSSSHVNVSDCLFEANIAEGFGGAIHTGDAGPNNDGTLNITNSIFNFNQAAEQGGALNISDANTVITSCLFTNNIATSGTTPPTGRGGAIALNVDSTHLDVTIMNSTFYANIGEYAAGISNWTGAEDVSTSNTVLQNNIFAHDGSINYAIEAGAPVITSNGGNLFDDDSFDDYLTHPKDLKVDDVSDLFVDPDADNYRLQNNSVAVDAGVDAGAPEFDIEGNPRLNEVDMGAYENQFISNANEVLLTNDGLLALSPNPAAGQFTTVTLDMPWTGQVQLRLTNLLGQTLKVVELEKAAGTMHFQLPLNDVGRGIYHLAASNGSQVVVSQLIRN